MRTVSQKKLKPYFREDAKRKRAAEAAEAAKSDPRVPTPASPAKRRKTIAEEQTAAPGPATFSPVEKQTAKRPGADIERGPGKIQKLDVSVIVPQVPITVKIIVNRVLQDLKKSLVSTKDKKIGVELIYRDSSGFKTLKQLLSNPDRFSYAQYKNKLNGIIGEIENELFNRIRLTGKTVSDGIKQSVQTIIKICLQKLSNEHEYSDDPVQERVLSQLNIMRNGVSIFSTLQALLGDDA